MSARRFDATVPGFEGRFAAFLAEPRGDAEDVAAIARAIVEDVHVRGLEAVLEHTERLDRVVLDGETMCVSNAEIEQAVSRCAKDDLDALKLAARRIRAFHERQRPEEQRWMDPAGVELGWRWTPIDAVGIYVPGGRASYPSSALMNAVPARVAGVERIVMTVPTPDGVLNPLVLAAAREAGVTEIYKIGGAQAVAALAYGAGPIQPVDKIVGPGNAYVAAAKRLVFGHVGIDTIAGPSEILLVADAENDPHWMAADLLSQAEHDPAAQAILITDDDGFAKAVEEACAALLERLPQGSPARASWTNHGAIVVVGDLAAEAPALVDAVAPEHVEIATADPDAIAEHIRHAGSIFLGRLSPEALGDYVTGSNHVLPTSRAARFSSGLATIDFMKRTTLQRVGAKGLKAIGPAAARLAHAEGLPAHAASVEARLKAHDD